MSCNTAFANLSLELGQDKLREQAQAFGFDQRHLADLNGVASRFPDDLDDAQLALSSIGQFDVAASPLQMAMVTAGIANDGVVMDPYLVSMVQAPDLKPLSTHEPTVLSEAMTPENAQELQAMMVETVASGTGGNGAIAGVEVGGKTGTAQSDPSRKPFAWFTSFAPADDPAVAVAVVVEDADIPRQDIAGGRVAAPIARAVMEAKSTGSPPRAITGLEIPYTLFTFVAGYSLGPAVREIQALGWAAAVRAHPFQTAVAALTVVVAIVVALKARRGLVDCR